MNKLSLELTGLAEELVLERQHTESRWTWDRNRNKKKLPEHVTWQPGLLAQLYTSAVDPAKWVDDSGAHGKPRSRPPLAVEAFSRYLEIERRAAAWCAQLGHAERRTAQGNIIALVKEAETLDEDTLTELVRDFGEWRRWAAILTGWENKLFVPRIECPVCEEFGSIRISAELGEGFCSQCQHYWGGAEEILHLAKQKQIIAA